MPSVPQELIAARLAHFSIPGFARKRGFEEVEVEVDGADTESNVREELGRAKKARPICTTKRLVSNHPDKENKSPSDYKVPTKDISESNEKRRVLSEIILPESPKMINGVRQIPKEEQRPKAEDMFRGVGNE